MPAPLLSISYSSIWFVFPTDQHKFIFSASLLDKSNTICFSQLEHILSICICIAAYIC